jgi:hypothetical protein
MRQLFVAASIIAVTFLGGCATSQNVTLAQKRPRYGGHDASDGNPLTWMQHLGAPW